MTTAAMTQAETEKQIRERLEETGEFGKMRAMIVEAALQSLARDQPAEAKKQLFYPSQALAEAKASAEGKQALGAVYAYLKQLGLQYSASVLALETGISADELASNSTGSAVSGLAAAGVLPGVGGHVPAVPAPVPVAAVGGGNAPEPAPASSSSASSSVASSAEDEEDEGAGMDGKADEATAEEPPQPGAEDSTYYISKWKKKTFVRVDQVVGQQVQVEYLTDCTVVVLDPLDSMTVDDCEGGQLVVAACEGSVFLRNCKNMTVHVACKQLRTRDCENVDLHIFTTTDPVVEMSHHMTFRPFHLRLPNLKQSFKDSHLDPTCNRFVHVYDFTADEPSLPQPHFTVTYPDPSLSMEDRYASHGAPECPPEIEDLLVGKLLPAASSESGVNKSYNIKTGSATWAATAAAATETPATTTTHPNAGDSSSEKEQAEEEEESVATEASEGDSDAEGDKPSTIPVPSVGKDRPPVAPLGGPRLGGLDNEEYSSFEDDSSESVNEDDKYDVEEDDDDF